MSCYRYVSVPEAAEEAGLRLEPEAVLGLCASLDDEDNICKQQCNKCTHNMCIVVGDSDD